ncbi:MAG: glycosyltransferase family 4 protein [Chromatiaceae bacterium]|nr:glycosyltransferase family 4 protein [Chromatiaceae bacterium]
MGKVRPDIAIGVNIPDLYTASRRLRARGVYIRTAMALHGIAADLLADVNREVNVLDAVIATNRLVCHLCTDLAGMPPTRVLYAPYGVDVAGLAKLPLSAAADVLRMAWVGRLEQDQKRVHGIAAILGGLDAIGFKYRLIIAGDGPERQPLLDALNPWIQAGRVEYLGVVPPRDVGPRVYAQSDALLLTSSWETGPIVIWEAMAAGLAVVSSRYVGSGLEGALKHEKNSLLFNVGDYRAASIQVARLGDVGMRTAIAAAGRQMVAERYSIGQSVRAWAGCVGELRRMPPLPATAPAVGPRPAGRLDRWFGVGLAESMRRTLGIRFAHASAGGEWPHTAAVSADEAALFEKAVRLDVSPRTSRPRQEGRSS